MSAEYEEQIARKFIALKQSARDRGLSFDLTLTSVLNLMNAKYCYYTGVKLNRVPGDPHQLTIDRIDNEKGYVRGNVVACSSIINSKKGELTIPEIVALYKATSNRT